jgi:hypothetical protein
MLVGENRAELLMRQASKTANVYMLDAVEDIDAKFGEGYAKAHPELVGAYMRAAAADFAATFQHDVIEYVSNAIDRLTDAVEKVEDR